jgi:peroxiredoxin
MKWGRTQRLTAWILGAALGASLVAFGLLRAAPGSLLPAPAVGAAAPTFSLPAIDGGSISLARLRGHAVLINFWASWCPYCRAETESLVTLHSACDRLTVLGVAVEAPENRVVRFATHAGIGYPILMDPSGSVAMRYGATYLPTSVLITPEGRIAWIHHGAFITADQARALVDNRLHDVCAARNGTHG